MITDLVNDQLMNKKGTVMINLKAMTFNNAVLNSKTSLACAGKLEYNVSLQGPVIDSGAPYSAISTVELFAISYILPALQWNTRSYSVIFKQLLTMAMWYWRT